MTARDGRPAGSDLMFFMNRITTDSTDGTKHLYFVKFYVTQYFHHIRARPVFVGIFCYLFIICFVTLIIYIPLEKEMHSCNVKKANFNKDVLPILPFVQPLHSAFKVISINICYDTPSLVCVIRRARKHFVFLFLFSVFCSFFLSEIER